MRLLILNPDLPVFPGRAGHEYLHTTRLGRHGHRVGLVSLVHNADQASQRDTLAVTGVALYLWQNPSLDPRARRSPAAGPSRLRRLAGAVTRRIGAGLLAPVDTVVQEGQFANLARPLVAALTDEAWNAVVVIQSSCARWLDRMPSQPVHAIVLHDVRALVYDRRAAAAATLSERVRARIEAARYRRFERRACRRADLVITVSTADEAYVRRHYAPARLVTIPIPVDAEYFRPQPDVAEAPTRVLFSGMMDHPPNVDAACFFADEVFPIVRRAVPESEFWIVGRDPAPSVARLATRPGIVVTGFVPDIRPHVAAAAVVVVPLRYGSGMRNKILEAWAMERCVVSTTIGAEGLAYRDGEDLIVADGASALAERTVTALRDPGLRDRVRRRGRAIVTARHDPDRLAGHYAGAISAVLDEKRARGGPMRVLIDLRWMLPGVAGGIENMSRSFLGRLTTIDRYNTYRLLVPSAARWDFDLRANGNFEIVPADGWGPDLRQAADWGISGAAARLGFGAWNPAPVKQLRRLREYDVDVVLSPSGYIAAELFPLANVLVVHDLQHEYHPEFFSREALDERRRVFRESILRARRLIAVSEHTRKTVIERYRVDPDRITTVHEAADPVFETSDWPPARIEVTLARHGLTGGGYLFFPANTWPHKNHRAAIEALRALDERHGLRLRLACSGAAKEAHDDVMSIARDAGVADRVSMLGYCPLDEMPALYRGAAALVYPSLFEGFGIPLVEAMWCGCPIVSSNRTSLPEIGGDAALFVDPTRPVELADAVARLLADDGLRADMIRRGRARARQFSWTTFTTEIVRILRETWESRLAS